MTQKVNTGIAYMVGAQAMLAIMAACVRALKTLPLMEIVFLRSVGGMVLVASYMLIFNISFRGQKKVDLILRGILGLLSLASYYFAITQLNLSTATLLANTSPILVVLLAGIFLKEPITLKLLTIISLSLAGVFLLVQPEFQSNILGYSVGLVSAFFIAFAFLYIRKLKNENSFVVVFYFVTVASLGSAPWALTKWVQPSLDQWVLVLVIGITSFFGQIWLTRAFQHGQAAFISAVGYSGPVFCWILGLVLFNEQMTQSAIAGALVILASGVILTLFGQKR